MAALEPRRRTVGVVLAGGAGQRVGWHPQAADQDRRQADHRAHARPVRRRPGDRRDHRADGARLRRARWSGSSPAGGFAKVSQIIEGGATRNDTTWRALTALGAQDCNVLLHDAVRPLLEPRIITRLRRGAGALLRPSTWRSRAPTRSWWPRPDRAAEIISDIPDRSTAAPRPDPAGFRLSVIREAYERALADPDFDKRPPPTTAAWCCATCPTCRSRSCRAASTT